MDIRIGNNEGIKRLLKTHNRRCFFNETTACAYDLYYLKVHRSVFMTEPIDQSPSIEKSLPGVFLPCTFFPNPIIGKNN
jgi:hypothetical protein